MNRNYTLSRLVAIFALVLACCCSGDVKATGCYNTANGYGNYLGSTLSPPCATPGSIAIASTQYTQWNPTAGATYTFGLSGGSWATYAMEIYWYNGSQWVAQVLSPSGGSISVTVTAAMLVNSPTLLIAVYNGTGCATYPSAMAPAWTGTSATLTYVQNNTLSNTTSTSAICANGSTRALTATPINGTFSLFSGIGSVSGTTYTAPGAGTSAGSATVRYTEGACTADASFTVSAVPSFASQAGSTTCSSFSYAPTGTIPTGGVTYAWSAPTGPATGGAAASGQSTVNGTLSNLSTAAVTEVYSVTPTAVTGGCSGSAFNVSVTVSPTASLSSQTGPTFCSGGTFGYAPTGTIPTGTTYSWSAPTGGAGGGAAASGQSNINGTLTNTTSSPITEVYSVTPLSGSCTGAAFNVSVTVNPAPILSSQTAPAICTGGSIAYALTGTIPAGTTYAWAAPTGGATGGSSASGQSNLNGSLTNSGSTAITEVYSVTPSAGTGCVGSAFNVSVTVNPTPALSGQSAGAVCTGGSVSYTPTGGTIPTGTTYSWAAPTGGAGGGAAASGQTTVNGTLTNSTASAITEVYSVTPLSGTCTGAAFDVSVTVNPKATISSQSAPAICTGGTIAYTPTGTIPSGTTYSWNAPSGPASGGASASGQTNINGSLVNSTSVAVTDVYVVTPLSGSCPGSAFNVSVTVNPEPVLANQSTSACAASSFSYAPTGSVVPAGTTYAWSAPTGSGFAGSGLGGSGSTLTDNLTITSGTTTTTATYSVTPTSGSCTGAAFNVSVTLYYEPSLSAQSTSSCSGQLFIYSPTGTIPSGTTYAWSAPSGTGFTGGASATGQNFLAGNLTLVSSLTPATATYSVTPTNGTCSGAAFNVSVTINSSPIISSTTTATCTNVPFNFTPTGAIPPGTTYAWNNPSGSGFSGGTSASGQADLNGTLLNSGTTPVTAVYSVTATAGACSGTAFNVSVTVNPTPVMTASQSTTACSSQNFTYTPTGTVIPGTTTYAWSSPTLDPALSGTAGAQTAQSNLHDNLVNSSNVAVTATYTVTPTAAGGCAGTPFTVTVTVNPTPVISAQSTSICGGTAIAYTITGSIIPTGTTYAWSAPSGSGFTGGAGASGQSNLNGTLSNTTNAAVTATYSVTPTGTATGGCVGSAFNVSVTVNPTPIISSQSTTACGSQNFTYSPTGIVPSGTTYDWSSPTLGAGLSGTAGAQTAQSDLNDNLVNSTASAVTATYSVTPTAGGCTGSAFTVTVTVNPTPVLNASQSTTSCSAQGFTYTPTGTIIPTGTTYAWSSPTLGTGLTGGAAASGQSNLNGTLSNSTGSAVTATYTVTPTAGSCSGTAFTVTVTVNPTPVLAGQSTSSCSGTTFNYTPTGSIIPAGTIYSWSSPTLGTGLSGTAGASSGTTLTDNLVNSLSGSVTATYSVTASSGTCVGSVFTVTVTVDPTPSLSGQSTTQCSDVSFTYTPTGAIVPSGITYAWSAPTGSGFTGGAGGSGGSLSATLSNGGTSAVTAVYSLTPTAGSCAGSPFDVTVTLNPSPTAAVVSDNLNPCNGGHTAYVDVTGGSSPYSFLLTFTGSATATTQSYTGTVPAEFDAQGASSITVSGIVDANGCPAASVTGSPVSYAGYALTPGNTQACTIPANSTKVFFDGSAKLMAKVTAGATALGSTTVITSVDGSVQTFGPTNPQSYLQRHFQITPTTNAAANVCLYISDAEVSALNTASASDNHSAPAYYQTFATNLTNANVTQYDGGAETPTSHTTSLTHVITSITATHNPVVDGATYTGVWEMCYNVSGFSGFYIHANNVNNDPLPVTLISFTAKAEDNKFIQLDWATATEIDNSGFQIERSTNGTEFEAIGWAQGHGNSTVRIDYRFSDLSALPGTVYYYRLKQVDLDGHYKYSNIVSASLTGSLGFTLETLVPNPASSQVMIGVISNVDAATTIHITDMLGRVVMVDSWQMSVGYNTQKFDLGSLAVGTYTVTIFSGDNKTSKRLVINR